MKMIDECELVKDLLPNYMEDLLSEKSNNFVKEHISKCQKCKKIFDNINIEINQNNNIINNEIEKEICFAKKYYKKINRLRFFVLLIIFFIVIMFARNAIILLDISKKANNYLSVDNFYLKYYQYDLNTITVIENYNKDGKHLKKLITFSKSNNEKIQEIEEYFDGNDNIYYINGSDVSKKSDVSAIPNMVPNKDYLNNNIFTFIRNCIMCKIKSVSCNGIDCYRIINFYSKNNHYDEDICLYIDKQTGMIVRISGEIIAQLDVDNKYSEYNMIKDFYYEFNTVTDNDLIKENT